MCCLFKQKYIFFIYKLKVKMKTTIFYLFIRIVFIIYLVKLSFCTFFYLNFILIFRYLFKTTSFILKKNKMKYKGILIEEISLFKHPLIYLELLIKVVLDSIVSIKNLIVTRFILIIALVIIWVLLSTVSTLYVFSDLFSRVLKPLFYLLCIGSSWVLPPLSA